MTTIVFETATFADVVKKADRVAPSKGNAFDKAAGIVIEVSPSMNSVVVRATDLNIYSMEWVDYVSAEGPDTVWRVPSKLFAQVVTGLPIGSGKTIKLEEVNNNGKTHLALSSGRTKAKFNLMQVDHYPAWSAFDPTGLIKADSLGGKVALVEWAAAKSDATTQLEGVHFDGSRVVATDRYRLACTELHIPDLPTAVTVPAGILGQILKQTGEVMLGVDEHQLLIMPDQATQVRAILYGGEYPKVDRIMNREYPDVLKVRKTPLLEVLNRAASFAGADRFPALKLFFGREEIAAMMDNEEVGLLGDVVEVPGYATHNRVQIIFTPKNIIDAIEHCPNDEFEIHYNHENPEQIMYLNGGSGYEAWMVPRKATDPKPE